MHIVKELIDNISLTSLNRFLADQKITNEQKLEFSDNRVMLETFCRNGLIPVEDLKYFFFRELLYGQHRLMRVYSLSASTCLRLKNRDTWNRLMRKYQITDWNYNQIIETVPQRADSIKLAVIQEERTGGSLTRVHLIFVFSMLKNFAEKVDTECSYIPVTIDLEQRCMIVKVWNQNGIIPESRPQVQLELVYSELRESLEIELDEVRTVDPQNVLYDMSRELFNQFFERLPNIKAIDGKRESLGSIIDAMLQDIPLHHVEQRDGKLHMPDGIINLEEELYRLIQQTALYDYREDYALNELLPPDEKYVSRIRFSDRDNLSANLTGENGVDCIYDAKTFMCIRDSLDIVKRIIALTVNFPRRRGALQVKYEADNYQFLTLHILDGKYYTEEEFQQIWGLYKTYERKRSNQGMFENIATADAKAM